VVPAEGNPVPILAATSLAALTGEAAAAGHGHWLTGAADSSHLTMRTLERPHGAMPADDPCLARSSEGVADRLSAAYAAALGPDAWFENGFRRDIWYLNILHFAAPVLDPRALIGWVAERRESVPIPVRVTEVEIAEWRFTGTGMAPRRLAASALV
jgi:hypothetical protein